MGDNNKKISLLLSDGTNKVGSAVINNHQTMPDEAIRSLLDHDVWDMRRTAIAGRVSAFLLGDNDQSFHERLDQIFIEEGGSKYFLEKFEEKERELD